MSWCCVMNFLFLFLFFATNFEHFSVLDPVMSSRPYIMSFNSQLVSLKEVLLFLLFYSQSSHPGYQLGLFYANEMSKLYHSDWLV